MAEQDGGTRNPDPSSGSFLELAIRLSLLAGLIYWSWTILRPLLAMILWSIIFAVALYPAFFRLTNALGGRRVLSAILITTACLLFVIGPVTWLGLGLVDGLQALTRGIESGALYIPSPSSSVRDWPLIGEPVFEFWELASTNLRDAFARVAPQLKWIGGSVLSMAQTAGIETITFLISIIIAGFLFVPAITFGDAIRLFSRRILSAQGDEFVDVVTATIRNVSRGVVGIALLQASLAGVGLVAAGVPAASFIAFAALILGIVQIGPSIVLIPVVIWSWTAMETVTAMLFTAYMVPVCLVDNVLRPLLMSRGLSTPMPVIFSGLIGGVMAHGIIGVFIGPIVLAVAWALLITWLYGAKSDAASPSLATPDGRSGV